MPPPLLLVAVLPLMVVDDMVVAFVIGVSVWPNPKNLSHLMALSAALLIGGLDFYRPHAPLVCGFALGLAATARSHRLVGAAGVAGGLLAALCFYLFLVGAEWRFIGFAFEQALPFIGCALAGALCRFLFEHFRSGERPVYNQ